MSAAGVRSWAIASHDTIASLATSSRSARYSENVGASSPVAHIGDHVELLVEQETLLVDLAVEVDRELWHPQQRSIVAEEAGLHAVAVADRHPTGEAEVAIEPRVQEHAPVDLDAELAPTPIDGVGLGLDTEIRAVGVGADDANRAARGVGIGDDPGDERARPANEHPTTGR